MKIKSVGIAIILLFVAMADAKMPQNVKATTVMADADIPGAMGMIDEDVVRTQSDEEEKKIRYDYIIVGGGAAGCILARKLSDDHSKSVLMLEAGPDNVKSEVTLDPFWIDNANTLLFNPNYAITYPIPTGFLSSLTYGEGRELGGGAAHNFLLAVRGTPSVYNYWSSVVTKGSAHWNYATNIRPLMKELETFTPNSATTFDPVERGDSGPIFVSEAAPLKSSCGRFSKFGISSNTDSFCF